MSQIYIYRHSSRVVRHDATVPSTAARLLHFFLIQYTSQLEFISIIKYWTFLHLLIKDDDLEIYFKDSEPGRHLRTVFLSNIKIFLIGVFKGRYVFKEIHTSIKNQINKQLQRKQLHSNYLLVLLIYKNF